MTHRAVQHFRAASQFDSTLWETTESIREQRGTPRIPDWPNWCYIPASHMANVLAGGLTEANYNRMTAQEQKTLMFRASAFAGLAAWRMSKGIYDFDRDLLDSLLSTDLSGDLPTDLLYRLPAWGIYISMPPDAIPAQLMPGGTPVATHGAFLWLEWDNYDSEPDPKLMVLLDIDRVDGNPGVFPLHVPLTGTLTEGVAKVVRESPDAQSFKTPEEEAAAIKRYTELLHPFISAALYLCSQEPDYGSRQPPHNAEPQMTKRRGMRRIPPKESTHVEVGARIGAIIRKNRDETRTNEREALESGRTKPVTHVRSAHWHLYWTGPRKGPRTPIIKWLPPTIVNPTDEQELQAVIRQVKNSEE